MAGYWRSLLAICAVGAQLRAFGNSTSYSYVYDQLPPPPSASAPKFYIRYAHPISLGCHQLYIVIVANGCGCTQGLFLVALENYSGWPGDKSEQLRRFKSSNLELA